MSDIENQQNCEKEFVEPTGKSSGKKSLKSPSSRRKSQRRRGSKVLGLLDDISDAEKELR